MSGIQAASGLAGQLPGSGRIDGYQSLSQLSEQRSVSINANDPQNNRQRLLPTLSVGEERNLIDKTKDIAANLFNAFRNEMREALHHVGIRGDAAADMIRDVSKSFTDAVRAGTSFSFGMIAAAYKETLVQTDTTMSHSLEFSANALSIEYNHVTGEITADTSKLEIDAVRVISGSSLPSLDTAALFDFTDGDGVPTIAGLFDRVQQYLANNGFIDEDAEDGQDGVAPALPGANDDAYDAVLINNERPDAAAKDDAPKPFEEPLEDRPTPESVRIQAVEEFTNGRQETITRMTLDLIVRVHIGKDSVDPETSKAQNSTDETFDRPYGNGKPFAVTV
ncbi:MAG: hypothetical protein O3B08_08385 [Proteobacteria bacterium]|nr:hypothetical protein [Pseudomonadota bacterium]